MPVAAGNVEPSALPVAGVNDRAAVRVAIVDGAGDGPDPRKRAALEQEASVGREAATVQDGVAV